MVMGLRRLLRYNSRHTVYFPRGYNGRRLPQLNPITSCSHGTDGKRATYMHEPLWLFRLRQRVFAYAGRQKCGRRGDSWYGATDEALPDTWDMGPDGCRTCSYCGSVHFDDLMEICRKSLTDERYGVEGTTKSYKVYVRQPGVRNASEGAIKFYKHHSPAQPTEEQQKLFADAVRLSYERFNARFNIKTSA